MAAAGASPRLRTVERPSLIAGWPGTGTPPEGTVPAPPGAAPPRPEPGPAGAVRPGDSHAYSVETGGGCRVASAALALTSTPVTVTPCRRASLRSVAGE